MFNQSQKIMKTKSMLALLPVICAALAVAQAPPNYTAAEAAKHVGETATVKDKVDGVHQSARGQIFLEHGGQGSESSLHGLYSFCDRRAVSSAATVRRTNGRCLWEDHFA
jgi:hypothetical protein